MAGADTDQDTRWKPGTGGPSMLNGTRPVGRDVRQHRPGRPRRQELAVRCRTGGPSPSRARPSATCCCRPRRPGGTRRRPSGRGRTGRGRCSASAASGTSRPGWRCRRCRHSRTAYEPAGRRRMISSGAVPRWSATSRTLVQPLYSVIRPPAVRSPRIEPDPGRGVSLKRYQSTSPALPNRPGSPGSGRDGRGRASVEQAVGAVDVPPVERVGRDDRGRAGRDRHAVGPCAVVRPVVERVGALPDHGRRRRRTR